MMNPNRRVLYLETLAQAIDALLGQRKMMMVATVPDMAPVIIDDLTVTKTEIRGATLVVYSKADADLLAAADLLVDGWINSESGQITGYNVQGFEKCWYVLRLVRPRTADEIKAWETWAMKLNDLRGSGIRPREMK